MGKARRGLVELGRKKVTFGHGGLATYVLAKEPGGGAAGRDYYMFGTGEDVYFSFWGCRVEDCGGLEEVRERLEWLRGFDRAEGDPREAAWECFLGLLEEEGTGTWREAEILAYLKGRSR